MPLLGKIVVIKRHGGDGTEFPLTASCLFGRKLDCDIRIQLPQVSKEHCKIELNENKELILTNLSSVNPTRINGQVLDQSERLKHGDLITIIDRSFRFEYPPPKTPKKKRLSTAGKDKTVQALQDQQENSTSVHAEKRKSEHSSDTCLKDGSNLPPPVDQSVETEPEDGKIKKDSMSPFGELYQMVKQDLAAKSPWKSELPKTPLARPLVDHEETADVKSSSKPVITPSMKKRRSSKSSSEDMTGPAILQSSFNANQEEKPADDMPSVGSITPSLTEKSTTPVSQKRRTPLKTPQKFSAGEVVQQILLEPQPEKTTPKSPKRRRSGGSQDQSLAIQMPLGQPQTPGPIGKNTEVKMSPRTSPRSNAGKRFQVQGVLHETKATTSTSNNKEGTSTEVTILKAKRKRVSFGGQLSPELFDKRLPPNSPLRRGATPRHSLGPSQKPQSLLRRASTIGLLALRLEETFPDGKKSSPKKASPKRAASAAKTPSPAKRSPSTKAKTPSPKHQKSPSASPKVPTTSSTSATPKTPASARRASTSSVMSLNETPRVRGRFSISRISTPSPDQEKSEVQSTIVEDLYQKCVTPKIPLRRKSMKSSARKTPKSAINSALDVIRSRRSGASRANLKVLTSWADIVKFGQTKPQTEVTTKKKPTKRNTVKRIGVPKPKTPARRLKDEISTGHAASPATIVVGKAHVRTNQCIGAAPKIVPNIALFKKDMKMDEDFTGVADIFKTPANSKSKNMVPINIECPEMMLDEISVMKTPEESGEMIVSPLSVISTAKCGHYNNEAVTRLLLANQDGSLLEDDNISQITDNSNEASDHDIISEMPPNDLTEEEEAAPETVVKTPKQKAAPSLCLTGVKRLMKTPKQRAEPIEDLRGKLLKTPKEYKPPQEESLVGIKELVKTPKYRGAPVEDMVGVKRVMQTPKVKNNPVLCAAGLQRLMKTPKEKSEQDEELAGLKELMKTPKLKGDLEENQFGVKRLVKMPKQKRNQVEEDLTGVQQLMKTPKHKGEPVEDQMGIKMLMQTPKQKVEPVEDLTGVKQLMQTPNQKGELFSNQPGIGKLMMAPQHGAMAEEVITGFEEPENNSTPITENCVTELTEIQGHALAVERCSAFVPGNDIDEECDKENVCPVETLETEVDSQCTPQVMDSQCTPEVVDLQCTSEVVDSQCTSEVVDSQCTSEVVDSQCTSEVVDSHSTSEVVDSQCTSEAMDSQCTSEVVDSQCTAEVIDSIHSDVETDAVIPQENHLDQSEEASVSVKANDVCFSGTDEKSEEQSEETVYTSENSNAVDPVTSSTAEEEKGEIIKSSPANKKIQRGSRGRAAQKSKDANNDKVKAPAVLSLTEEESINCPLPSSPARGRRGKKLLEVPEVAASPIRKSARGRIPKHSFVGEEENNTASSHVPVNSMKTDTSDCLPVVPKTRRGRKSKQDDADAAIEPVDINTGDPQCPDAPTDEELVQAPVVKPERKKIDKTGEHPSEELEKKTPEVVCEENAVAPEAVTLLASPVTETVSATRARRGRPSKKEHLKSEPTPTLANVITSTHAAVVAEKPVSPVAKSGRGRRAKKEIVQEQLLDNDAVVVSQTVVEETEPTPTLENEITSTHAAVVAEKPVSPVAKSGRGRRAKKEIVQEQLLDNDAVVVSQTVVEETEPTPTLENEITSTHAVVVAEKPVSPVAKSGRGRRAKKDIVQEQLLDNDAMVVSQNVAEETEPTPTSENEIASTHAAVVAEKPVSPVAKSGRGRRAKKEIVQEQLLDNDAVVVSQTVVEETEPTPTLENEITSTHAVVVAEKPVSPVAKSGRGRRAKKEIASEQLLDNDVMVVSQTVTNVDHEDEPEAPVVKSGRGRKAKQQKPHMPEEVVDQPAVDASAHLPVTDEHTETVVKSVRGSRKTKQSKAVSVETEENVSLVEPAETPVVKSGRKRTVIGKETEVEVDVSVKRGRRAADPAPPNAVVSSRGRKPVAKADSAVTEGVAASEEPAKVVKHTRRAAKVPESKSEENAMTQAGSELVAAENTAIVALQKVERGSRGRKQKDSTKDIPNNPLNESSDAEEPSEIKCSKTVNWNPDIVVSKEIGEFEPSADVEEQQPKKSKRLGKIPPETASISNQSIDLPPRGRRGAKKEHPVEEVQINIKPSRRGKAVGSTAPKSDPSDNKESSPLKRKRNDVLEITESSNKEPLPKKRGKLAISAKVAAEVSGKEKTPDTEPEKAEVNPKKTGNRAVRGQKKSAPEPAQESEPAPAQESVSGTTTRRGRNVKKVEAVDISTEAAPVRRTRRK